jgi:hypothetical protein
VRDDPAAVLRALKAAAGPTLPGAALAGATSRTQPATYDTKTIFDYIDGAAEGYIARGFQQCIAATFAFAQPSGPAVEVIAEVYRFSAEPGARQQLESERSSEATPIAAVPGAVGDATTLMAQRGPDYLKLTAMGDEPAARELLARLAAAWLKEQS